MFVIENVKDTGGMRAVRPIGDQLRDMGYGLARLANGVSIDALSREGFDYTLATSAEKILTQFAIPDVLLTSMCSEGGVGRDLIPLLRSMSGEVKVVAVQDQWGARLLTDWKDLQYRPDHLIVNDEVATRIVLKAWPEFPRERIYELGYAALDAIHGFDVAASRQKTRTALGITDDLPLIYFSGQVLGGTPLRILLSVLHQMKYERKVIADKHPRMNDPEQIEVWENAERVFHDLVLPMPKVRIPEIDRICAADVTVGTFPTAFTHCAALRRPAISMMFPGSEMESAYANVTGGLMRVHPLVELGCVAGPRSILEFKANLDLALRGGLEEILRPWQIKHIKVDGHNARRIAEFISSLG